MTYYGGKNLSFSFKQVRNNTIQIAEEIPEAKYSFKSAPDTRSIGQLLTHIALGAGIQMHIHGSQVNDLKAVNFMELFQKSMAEEAKPRTKAETIALLKTEGDKVATFLEGLSDDFLAETGHAATGDCSGDQDALRDADVDEGTRDPTAGSSCSCSG